MTIRERMEWFLVGDVVRIDPLWLKVVCDHPGNPSIHFGPYSHEGCRFVVLYEGKTIATVKPLGAPDGLRYRFHFSYDNLRHDPLYFMARMAREGEYDPDPTDVSDEESV